MNRVGWVVDCQWDFMNPSGRLYVKDLFDDSDAGAVKIEGKLVQAVAWMREHCEIVVFTGDWHGYDDAEIDTEAPDPERGTYPPHCMGRSEVATRSLLSRALVALSRELETDHDRHS